MCGIAGVVDLKGGPASPQLVKAMTDSISHRGPDGEGQWIQGNVGIGHRRLSIIDLSPAGQQPMVSHGDRYVLSYNGEIYNYKELRASLQDLGYQFRSGTDSEVVLYSLAEWGAGAINRFSGMFALAFYDQVEKTLFLARDRYGIKPLYYAFQSGRFYFGSEQKAIFADTRFRRDLNHGALLEYFTFQNFFTDQTLDRDVHLMPAGHYGILNTASGNWGTTKYWDYSFHEPSARLDIREYEEELGRLVSQAVSRQLLSDVEIGTYLSGGIDSGAITALASRAIPNLKSFTIGFDLSSATGLELAFDERSRAEAVSAQCKTEHYEMVLKAGDMERCVPLLVNHLEEPRVGQSYPNFYAAKLASKFVKVVLSGTGGDEMFAGYPWRYQPALESNSFDAFESSYFASWQRLATTDELRSLFAPIWDEVKHVDTRDIFRNVLSGYSGQLENKVDLVNLSLYFEAKTFLHGLLVVEDKLSMAFGLEARVPFLDNDLVDFAMSCPVDLKLDMAASSRVQLSNVTEAHSDRDALKASGKQILRRALGSMQSVDLNIANKQGFSAPDASWFKGESLQYLDKAVKAASLGGSALSVLDQQEVGAILSQHTKGVKNRRLLVWSFLYTAIFNNKRRESVLE